MWGSIGPFCFLMQNGPIEPKATKSTLFFLFAFIHLLCLTHVARPLEAMHSITEMPQVAAGENVSQKLETFVVSVHLCSVNLCTLTLVLHSPHPWQVVDNCKTSMVELILQLLVHCLNSPCIFPTTHKWQDLAAHPGCRTHRPNKVLLETLFLTHNQ